MGGTEERASPPGGSRAKPWLFLLPLLLPLHVWAAAGSFDPEEGLTPVIEDTTRPQNCTVTYLVTDTATNDVYAARMVIPSGENERAVKGLMPCPKDIPLRVPTRALEVCISRAADPKTCVFADMGRGFEKQPLISNTVEETSSCASDTASQIGLACARAGALELCGVGCGPSPQAAIAAAVSRCAAKHQRSCPVTGSLPVLAPR